MNEASSMVWHSKLKKTNLVKTDFFKMNCFWILVTSFITQFKCFIDVTLMSRWCHIDVTLMSNLDEAVMCQLQTGQLTQCYYYLNHEHWTGLKTIKWLKLQLLQLLLVNWNKLKISNSQLGFMPSIQGIFHDYQLYPILRGMIILTDLS